MQQQQPKKRKRPQERSLPLAIADWPEYTLYSQLQHQERKLDTLMVRKRLEIQEALTRPVKQKKKLRIFVSNTSAYQHVSTSTLTADIPSWTLRVEGRLMDVLLHIPWLNVYSDSKVKGAKSTKKMSSFMRKIVIELDRDPELFPEGNLIEVTSDSKSPF